MSKKKSPVDKHKEKDAKLLRAVYLSIIRQHIGKTNEIEGSSQEVKNVIEASKNLARMHHLLQPDKVTQKESKKEETPFTEAENKKIDDRVASILGDTWTGLSEPS